MHAKIKISKMPFRLVVRLYELHFPLDFWPNLIKITSQFNLHKSLSPILLQAPEKAIGYHSKSIANQLGIDSQNIPGKTFSFRMYVHVRKDSTKMAKMIDSWQRHFSNSFLFSFILWQLQGAACPGDSWETESERERRIEHDVLWEMGNGRWTMDDGRGQWGLWHFLRFVALAYSTFAFIESEIKNSIKMRTFETRCQTETKILRA